MIRPDLLKNILESLQSHQYLSHEDFIIQEFEGLYGNPGLKIEYRYDETLFLSFTIPTQKDKDSGSYEFALDVRPGYESIEESLRANGRRALMSEVKKWLGRLYEDVVSAPIGRQLHDHKNAIDQLRVRLASVPAEPLSRTDAEVFREDLDRLKKELVGRLQEESASTKQLEDRIETLTRDIDFLKGALDSMTKRQWGELLFARIHQWRTRFPLTKITAGAKVLKFLMPGEAGDLDAVARQVDDMADGVGEPEQSEAADGGNQGSEPTED